MNNIDNISYFVLLAILFSALFFESELMGGLSLIFSGLVIFKKIFSFNSVSLKLEKFDKALIIYFLIVSASLLSSSLFSLSLHGYIKTFIYILFYFCTALYFSDSKNKKRVFPLILAVAIFMGYEAIVAILQNMSGVDEISGWQDMSRLNPEEVISRAYGTLKPYNPNLLAGYLLCGLSFIVYLILSFLNLNKKRVALFFTVLFFAVLIAIIDTGCRGAYLGFMLFFPTLFWFLGYYVCKNLGGFSKIKKRYKNISLLGISGIIVFILTNPALIHRFQSILAFRNDSSISFRLNVYESALRMFFDNIFLGIGCGNQNFREIYGLYMKTGFDALGVYCVPLEIAVENGIFALIAFLLFLYFVLKKCFNICLNDFDMKEKILALNVILMICACFGHGLFDTIWFRPQLQFLFWTNIALLRTVKK